MYNKSKIGEKHGRLTVILENRLSNTGRPLDYWCLCDCKTITRVEHGNLRWMDHTKSCGCYKKEMAKTRNQIGFGEAAFNGLFQKYQQVAINRNLEFKLTKEQFKAFTKLDCYYCGTKPSQVRVYGNSTPYVYNGVDRLNNLIGYVLDNCVPCCGDCNQMKHKKTYKYFISKVSKIYEHHITNSKSSTNRASGTDTNTG